MKRTAALIIAFTICLLLCACGQEDSYSDKKGKRREKGNFTYSEAESASGKDEKEESGADDLFKRVGGEYVFSSGAGGWSTDITLNADGTFKGEYYDSNYLDENNVEILCSKFHGRFSKVKKVNEYTYSAELADLTYDTQTGTEEISDHSDLLPGGQEIWRYTEAYGLEKCKTVYFYLKGAPMSSLPEEFIGWGYGAVGLTGEESTLPMNGFYNTEEEYGFFRREDG